MTPGRKLKTKLERVVKYEYWPYFIFYFPLLFYGFYLAFRSRSATYFTTTNPSMKYGGIMGESKKKILDGIPARYTPSTLLVDENTALEEIKKQMVRVNLSFPVVVKPDIGERGSLVEKIENEYSLMAYLQRARERFLIQEYIDFPIELGVLYYKKPGATQGQISSIVKKEFLQVTGNGTNTVEELLEKEVRAFGRMDYLKKKLSHELNTILKNGEKKLIEPIGNHCRGTAFYNGNALISPQLVGVFDRLAENIEGFYYGRFDLKVKSIEDLYRGKNIKILELNGVSSEPAHVYDPDYTLLTAYRDVIYHMKVIYEIARINHLSGHKRASFAAFVKDIKQHLERKKRRQEMWQS